MILMGEVIEKLDSMDERLRVDQRCRNIEQEWYENKQILFDMSRDASKNNFIELLVTINTTPQPHQRFPENPDFNELRHKIKDVLLKLAIRAEQMSKDLSQLMNDAVRKVTLEDMMNMMTEMMKMNQTDQKEMMNATTQSLQNAVDEEIEGSHTNISIDGYVDDAQCEYKVVPMDEDMSTNDHFQEQSCVMSTDGHINFAKDVADEEIKDSHTNISTDGYVVNAQFEYKVVPIDEDMSTNDHFQEQSWDLKPKPKKKPKKAKFKSLKKGSLTSGLKPVKEESQAEPMNIDDEDITGMEFVSPNSSMQKKRKSKATTDGEEKRLKKSKKSKRDPPDIYASDLESNALVVQYEHAESKTCESLADFEPKTAGRGKMGGKISIIPMPVKRIWTIKPEKMRKGNHWSKDCIPSADFWLAQEDAILCAVVHEYGPNWSLVSDILNSMTAGGSYRGRYRHPVHCCERFRELFQKNVLSMDNANNEKTITPGSGKALLKVTEDNIRMLLDVASEQANRELLLQKHFFALLSSAWKVASHVDRRQNPSPTCNGLYFDQSLFTSIGQPSQNSLKKSSERVPFANLVQSKKLVAAALDDSATGQVNDKVILPNQGEGMPMSADRLDITLEFPKEESDVLALFPSVINLSIHGTEPTPSLSKQTGGDDFKIGLLIAENRFREATRICEEDVSGWASSAFPTSDARSRPGSRIQSSGKQKSSISDSAKPSRSKSKRASIDASEMHHHQADSIFQSVPLLKDLRFDLAPFTTDEIGLTAVDTLFPFDLNVESSWEMEGVGMIPHDYVTGLISDLDDCTTFPEYTDIR
ncbi:E1A-binding protein [Vigna unguiculata]|uniref:E1A-binding protein n=1 Tax=Vigna unguiculata TaxID=3917 RepID=A0A4D6MXF5_VIGUN|nr:E1A-binding protein [Vigna unguiculata]